MSKPIKVTDAGVVSEEVKGAREARWDAFVANYAIKNPVKYASKRATEYLDEAIGSKTFGEMIPKKDEFAEIPASFR